MGNTSSEEPEQNAFERKVQRETILVLDDDQNLRAFIGSALEKMGYRFLEAADVRTAMLILEEEGAHIDLLLLDVALPGGVGGPEFAVRAREQFPDLKLVFMSGYAADLYTGDKVPGFDEILLSKPFDLVDLVEAVQASLAT